MGGHSEVVMRRAARLADGWIWSGNLRPDTAARATVDTVHKLVTAAGRDPGAFGIEGRVTLARLEQDRWANEIAAWRALRGVTHLCVDTMRIGLTKPDQHIETLRRFKEAARV
jgi:alkanesulfonate monooxygenase SsuD/methylene tetrahydromethanopterin reductase-like flavin-dependent oxidoreductase (luciferase family)